MVRNAILMSASIAALSIAGSALAQTAPAPPLMPTSPPAVTDCPGTPNNCSIVDQSGANNSITLIQSGDGNTSNIEQNGNGGLIGNPPTILVGNQVTVTQSGDDNTSNVDQVNNTARGVVTLTQSGTNATSSIVQDAAGILGFPTRATVNQSGDGAEAIVLQTGTRNHSAFVNQTGDNDAYIQQDGFTQTRLDTTASVRQSGGDGNLAAVFQQSTTSQVGSNGNNGVTQTGDFNISEVYQLSGGAALRARTDQTGDRNDSILIQSNSGGSGFGSARLAQTGDDNISSIVQTGSLGAAVFNGVMVNVQQAGSDNLSRVVQDNNGSGAAGTSGVNVIQNNDGNDSFVDQNAGVGRVQVTQNSNDTSGMVSGTDRFNIIDSTPMLTVNDSVRANFSRVVQRGTSSSDAVLSQTGFGNRSDIRQTNNTASFVADADVTQVGTDQNSDILQTDANAATVNQGVMAMGSEGNTSFVEQIGFGDLAFVDQVGTFNEAQVAQTGGGMGGNDADIDQSGTLSFAGIEQSGTDNNADTIQQASADGALSGIIQDGIMNFAEVTQAGVGDFSLINQTGNGNSATVSQNVP